MIAGDEDAQQRDMLLKHCKAQGIKGLRDVVFLDPYPLLTSGKPDLQRIATLTGCVL